VLFVWNRWSRNRDFERREIDAVCVSAYVRTPNQNEHRQALARGRALGVGEPAAPTTINCG
jgi:hypothetical protein